MHARAFGRSSCRMRLTYSRNEDRPRLHFATLRNAQE
jgi:hypothetical protein